MADCRNDCVKPPVFPKELSNRPGLARMNYRVGSYADIREYLLRALDVSPALASWTYRKPDDAGIALLEGAAIVGDILTFYQDLYANEAYLGTAQWRESVGDLVRLVGYRLTPGVGGRATFTFEVKGDKPIVVPAGFPIKADVEGPANPTDFETTGALTAVPELSRFSLYQPFLQNAAIKDGTKQFAVETTELEAVGLKIQPNDRVMLVDALGGLDPKRQIAVVEAVATRFEKTEITIKGGWQRGAVAGLMAYKLGRSLRRFGHNAPPTTVRVDGGVASQRDTSYDLTASKGVFLLTSDSSRPTTPYSFPLDQQVDDLATGSTMLVSLYIKTPTIDAGDVFFERTILGTTKSNKTVGSMSGACTEVHLNDGLPFPGSATELTYDLRTIEFHEVIGKKVDVTGVRTPNPTSDTAHLFFFGPASIYEKLDRRRVQLVRPDPANPGRHTVDEATIAVEPVDPTTAHKAILRRVSLAPAPAHYSISDFPLQGGRVVVYGNLADATQGKTEGTAILGNGDSRQAFQTFRVPKAPLTYLPSNSATPPQTAQLEITVDGRIWKQVASLFGRAQGDQVYIVREDSSGESWIQFGDGVNGARPHSGIDNVVAKYRTGIGSYGALKPDAKPQPGSRLDRLDKIQLAGEASGGAQAESGNAAREAAPGKIQSLGRLVSLRDFETEALTISGVSKSSAAWELFHGVPTLLVTILMETGRDAELDLVRKTLGNYNICRGPQRFPISVVHGRPEWVFVDAVFALAPTYVESIVLPAVRQALSGANGLFAPTQRRFGEAEYKTRIEGVIQNVEGVAWAEVKAFGPVRRRGKAGTGIPGGDPSKLVLPPAPKPLDQTINCSSSGILSLWDSHLQVTVASAPSAGVCA